MTRIHASSPPPEISLIRQDSGESLAEEGRHVEEQDVVERAVQRVFSSPERGNIFGRTYPAISDRPRGLSPEMRARILASANRTESGRS